jgi:tripartite-type tricarboxylate transporter receptor subunit TctC
VHPDFPANDGKSMMEELRKNPKKYTYGTDGLGGPAQQIQSDLRLYGKLISAAHINAD